MGQMRGAGEDYDQDVYSYIAGVTGACNEANDPFCNFILDLFDLEEVQLYWSLATKH
jgi:hypothetical protein